MTMIRIWIGKKAECIYFKNIAKQYGVQFEPGELTEEKLLHLSQD